MRGKGTVCLTPKSLARELGMNPQKLSKLDNHDQELWKMPLRQFIQYLYHKRFGKDRPDIIQTIEDKLRRDAQKKAIRREAKLLRRQSRAKSQETESNTNASDDALDYLNVSKKHLRLGSN